MILTFSARPLSRAIIAFGRKYGIPYQNTILGKRWTSGWVGMGKGLLCKFEDIKDKLFHFDPIVLVWLDSKAGRVGDGRVVHVLDCKCTKLPLQAHIFPLASTKGIFFLATWCCRSSR